MNIEGFLKEGVKPFYKREGLIIISIPQGLRVYKVYIRQFVVFFFFSAYRIFWSPTMVDS